MYKAISRTLLGTAAAGVTLATFGLGSASASTAAPVVAETAAAPAAAKVLAGPVFSATRAGYLVGFGSGANSRFRYITTTFTIPACASAVTRHGWRGYEVLLGAESSRWRAQVVAGCDPGGKSRGALVHYRLVVNGRQDGPGLVALFPQAGDRVTLSAEYARKSGRIRLAASDDTRGDEAERILTIGTRAQFRGAEVGSVFRRWSSSPARDLTAGHFSATQLTTYNGRKGTLLGPWPTRQVIATAGASPRGDVLADAPMLLGKGSGFFVYRHSS